MLPLPGCFEASITGEIAPYVSDGLESSALRIFVSSSTVTGDFGGITVADQLCLNDASAVGLSRTYKAILSDNAQNAVDRFTQDGAVYIFDSTAQKILVADSLEHLFSTLTLPLYTEVNHLPDGTNVVATPNVFTGSTADGIKSANNCSNWTSTGGTGRAGRTNQKNDEWLNWQAPACSGTYRLYCLSQ